MSSLKESKQYERVYSFIAKLIWVCSFLMLIVAFVISAAFRKSGNVAYENVTQDVDFVSYLSGVTDSIITSVNSLTSQDSYVNGSDNNHLFLNTSDGKNETDYINVYSSFAAGLQKYCEERGIEFLYMLNPGKAVVYEEYYNYDDVDRQARNQYIVDSMKDKGVNVIYTLSALMNQKAKTPVYGVKYDTGHWNDHGAYAAISAAINLLRQKKENIAAPSLDNYNIYKTAYTSIPYSHVPIVEVGEVYELKDNWNGLKINNFEKYVKTAGNNDYTHYLNLKRITAPKLLIFGGSYTDGRGKFYSPSFGEVIYIKSYFNVINYEYYISLFQPDAVIFESADYVMNDSFVSYENMKKKVSIHSYNSAKTLPEQSFCIPVNGQLNNYGEISEISVNTEAKKVSAAYVTAGNLVYDCSITEENGVANISAAAITGHIANEDIYMVLVSADGKAKQIIRIYK